MDRDRAKRLVLHAVATTEPRWREYAVSWESIDRVFVERGYEQQGFRCFRFVPFLDEAGIYAIDALGSVLTDDLASAPYDATYAKGLDAPFFQELRAGRFGETGRRFAGAVVRFLEREPRSGGRFFWRYLWLMLQGCWYLRRHHESSFARFVLDEYRRFAGNPSLSQQDLLDCSAADWAAFLEGARPWRKLRGVGENVFDFILGDVREARFARDSFKFDSANQHFLRVTGIGELIQPFERGEAIRFLRDLDLPYTLREINKGLYTYCSRTEEEKYGYCRSASDCARCAVAEICGKHLGAGRPSAAPKRRVAGGCEAPHRPASAPAPDRDELVEALRAFDPAPTIERYRRRDLDGKSPSELLRFAVDQTIYRALQHEGPKQRYLRWRWHDRADELVTSLNAVEGQASFDRFARALCDSLVADWGATNDRGQPTRMNAGIAMKIVNLVLEHLAFSDHVTSPRVVEWLHVPWDSFTLRPLRRIWSGRPPITSGASQGFVTDRALYERLHATISRVAAEAGVPRIHYELWAWDRAHGS